MPTNYWNLIHDNITSANRSVTDCPSSTPYYNGTQCIKCTSPNIYFNLDTRVCQSCNGSYSYDAIQRECINTSQGPISVSGDTLKMSGTLFSHQKQLQQMMHGASSIARHQITSSE